MGLFDLFKKKICATCRCRIQGEAWTLENREYCRECYNRKMMLVQQTAGRVPEEYDFEMEIADVFRIEGRGVAVTGQIRRGTIHVDDTVMINGREYTVHTIDVPPNQVKFAKQGMHVGLELATMDAKRIKSGDVVTAKRAAKKAAGDTFACVVCGRERALKYRHRDGLCVDCAERANRRDGAGGLGKFDIPEIRRKKMRMMVRRYKPQGLPVRETQMQLLDNLACITSIAVAKERGEQAWRLMENAPEDQQEERQIQATAIIMVAVEEMLSVEDPQRLKERIGSASTEMQMKAWLTLDYYALVLREEVTAHIREARDYIHTLLMERETDVPDAKPVEIDDTGIHFDSEAFAQWRASSPTGSVFEIRGVLPLTEKEPTVCLYEDGVKTREYVLQTEGNEDFTGKFLRTSARVSMQGVPAVPVIRIDGFVSETREARKMTHDDVGYRMEVHFLDCGGSITQKRREMNRGQDLPMKALKYLGYTTPSNVRLIGVCADCGRSFCFHGYAFYMGQSDVAYSDDGLDCCELQAQDIDKDTWVFETEGKTFRYYNSFNCPHCGAPYIDYRRFPETKVFGVSGCVHMGRKPYRYE